MLVVQPERDPVGQALPFRLILENALPGAGIELLHTEAFNILLAAELELLLHLDLDREAVGVPPRDAGDRLTPHGVKAADEVLDRSRENVVDAGAAVGRGRALVEHERRSPGPLLQRALK